MYALLPVLLVLALVATRALVHTASAVIDHGGATQFRIRRAGHIVTAI